MADSSGKTVVVVESPAKAKTIARFLGDEYQVEASYGHVRDLPQSAKEIPAKYRKEGWARLGVNTEAGFEPIYVVPADKKPHVKRLKDALKGADRLLLATDEDREGESISWHVLELVKPKRGVTVERIVFHEVTPEAIRKALASPRQVDDNLVRAQEARRVLDRLYGYSLSPLLWKRVAPGLSAGRVQSVAVRLLVEQERSRIAFRKSTYWDVKAQLATDEGEFRANLIRVGEQRLADGSSFDASTGLLAVQNRIHLDADRSGSLASAALEARPWTVTEIERRPGRQNAAPPFTTSTLQQEANRKLRFTARRTMRVAQSLYEGVDLGGERVGLITYMRTDSVSLADRAVEQARAVIREAYGSDYVPDKPMSYRTKAKGAQEAHEAIRPTDLSRRPQDVRAFLDADGHRLYELIWKRTLACQMPPARFERTKATIEVDASGHRLAFAARGKRIVFPGFLRAYVEGSDDPDARLGDQESILPALEQDQTVQPKRVDAEEHSTKAPARFTEASLVKKLEEEGIGRPSTYASIISTIQDRGYAFKRGNELVPTFTAFCVTQLLEKQFGDLVDTSFTAEMENHLDEIAAGKQAWVELVADFYHGEGDDQGLLDRVDGGEVTYPEIALGHDPESDDPVVVKIGRYGPYLRRGEGGRDNQVSLAEDMPPAELSLERALDLLREKREGPAAIATDPATGRKVVLQQGRFGAYLEREQSDAEKEAGDKPHRVSLPKGLTLADLTPEIAATLIQLPRTLGNHPETGDEIVSGIGRYGPFVRHGRDFRSLKTWTEACTLDLDAALAIVSQPKQSRRFGAAAKTVLRELEGVQDAAGDVKILDGRYGPYVTDGETNASLPKGTDPGEVTPEMAAELLTARRNAPKKKRRRRRA